MHDAALKTVYDKALLQRVKRMRLGSRTATADVLGGYRSRQKGHGLEYIESRGYEPGDDVRRMDWKVTARTREPYVKVFQQERQLRLLMLVDVSHSMRFGGPVRTRLQTALSVAMALAYAAVREHDVAQLVLFSDGIDTAFPAMARERDFWAVSRQVEQLAIDPYGARSATGHLDAVVEHTAALKQQPQLAFLFSDFQPADQFNSRAAAWPRRVGLLPVRVRTEPLQHRRLRPRGFDAETGGGVSGFQPEVADSVLGRSPIEVSDSEELWLALRRLITRIRSVR